jgi:hypothetical protein
MLLLGPIALGALAVTWCMLLVWVIRIAESRGRSMIVWGLIAVAAGLLGPMLGLSIANQLLDTGSTVPMALSLIIPFAALIIPMAAIGVFQLRSPIAVANRARYELEVLGKGRATVEITDGIKLTLDGQTLTGADITKVEADGECVRITLGERDLTALPLGKPQTPDGRKRQSLLLAKQLRTAKSLH